MRINERHGLYKTREYRSWQSMKDRCYNKNNNRYYLYGERGIVVCDRWLNSFVNFYKDMGSMPDKFTLDRIDSNANYCPSNCRWVSLSDQAKNKRSNKMNWLKVEMVRYLHNQGVSGYELSKLCNVNHSNMCKILRGELWRASV